MRCLFVEKPKKMPYGTPRPLALKQSETVSASQTGAGSPTGCERRLVVIAGKAVSVILRTETIQICTKNFVSGF